MYSLFRMIIAGLALGTASYASATDLLGLAPTVETLSESIRAHRGDGSMMSRFVEEQGLVGEGETLIFGDQKFGSHLAILLKRSDGKFFAVKDFLSNRDGSITEMAFRLPEDAVPGEIALNGLSYREAGKPVTKIFRYYSPSWGPKVSTSEAYVVETLGNQKLRTLISRKNEFGALDIYRSLRDGSQFVDVQFKDMRRYIHFEMNRSGVAGTVVDAKLQANHLILTVYDPVDSSFQTLDVPATGGEFEYTQIKRTALTAQDVRKLRIFSESKTIPGRSPAPTDGASSTGMTVETVPGAPGTAQ